MTNPDRRPPRVSRESRLLLITIAICAVVLVALARLRFPQPPAVVTAAPPLERLAAQASYDALAADIERVEALIAPNLVVLRIAAQFESAPRDIRDLIGHPGPPVVRHVAALRVDSGIALASIDPELRIDGIVGGAGGGSASLLGTDPIRRIARVRVPDAPVRRLPERALAALQTPVYVVAVEGTQAGVTVRPVFLGRGDRFSTARWSRPLLPLGGNLVSPGALLFSLDGEFIGTVVVEDGAPAIAGARDVLETLEGLASTPLPQPPGVGIAVQPLTPTLAAATGVPRGVVVSDVWSDGPADGILQTADVIVTADGQATDNPDELLLHLASRRAGQGVALGFVRRGEARTVSIALAPPPPPDQATSPVTFVREHGETHAIGGATASGSGLMAGDIVTRAGTLDDPSPAQLRRLLAEPGTAAFQLLTVRRNGRQRVVAVPTKGAASAPRE